MNTDLSPAVLASVMVGGALGGLLRMWVGSLISWLAGNRFPWGTLVVNLSGSVAIGILAGLWIDPTGMQPEPLWQAHWTALVVGLLGSYTTVSSFSLQTLELFNSGRTPAALANITGSLVLCLSGAAAAFHLTRGVAGV